jgi:UDP-GlcNAc:undecaprenyl-phosphate/decaprenyl-phosphate GlcNAc-1-phosphate transferase
MIFFLVFATAFLLMILLTPLAARIALRTGAIDRPAQRRIHSIPIARLGGLSIFVAFLAAIGVSLTYSRTDPFEVTRLAGLVIGVILMFLVGVYDDHREMKSLPQLLAQVSASIVAVASGVLITELPNPLGGVLFFESWFAILFTIFWLVGMVNTINWLDGVDGLASGVIVIAGMVMFVHTFRLQQYSISLLVLALIATALGFWFFNFSPAQIFMGSAGANVLGFALGVIAIIGGAKVATTLLVLLIPILDVAWQILNRLRAGKSPTAADRGHLHHRLLDLGFSQRAIAFLYYGFTAIFGALALVLPSGIYKLMALVVIGFGAVLVLFRLGARTARRIK